MTVATLSLIVAHGSCYGRSETVGKSLDTVVQGTAYNFGQTKDFCPKQGLVIVALHSLSQIGMSLSYHALHNKESCWQNTDIISFICHPHCVWNPIKRGTPPLPFTLLPTHQLFHALEDMLNELCSKSHCPQFYVLHGWVVLPRSWPMFFKKMRLTY